MGSVGDSYDNALMENFWSTLKIELVYRTSWRIRDEAENAIFAYIDGWYNIRRIQRELGYPQSRRVRDHLAQPPDGTNRATYRHPSTSREQVTTALSKRGKLKL
ncbi:transposase [Micromonospora sp. NEAU-HG-1]|nr:transposase [Micromonospora rubida]